MSDKNILESDDDFGFTFASEEEATKISELTEEAFKDKLQQLERLILPLLYNLKKNPEKEYIHWANRVPIIDKQIEKILEITRS